ncbi:Appr-1-p processing protein [Sorangium sp. So ce1078]|uniref:Appr-1-p processing protein n=1 Tax=Sorangium sp. So ce1078 TaxID=3133329 RepID=UPI003F613211
MTTINYVDGDATRPVGEGSRIIAHVCNDIGGWGRGFVTALSARWAAPEAEYRRWHRGELAGPPFGLGQVQFVEVEARLWVANMIGQHGVKARGGVPPVRYEAIDAALVAVAAFARQHDASVHMPRIGAGLAGGRWSEIEPLIERNLCSAGLRVNVYDLPGQR